MKYNKLEKFEKKILEKLPKIYLILFCIWKRRNNNGKLS